MTQGKGFDVVIDPASQNLEQAFRVVAMICPRHLRTGGFVGTRLRDVLFLLDRVMARPRTEHGLAKPV
ncbi:hypothetical protein SPI_04515 [Niveomyces insectorum RCEF 264]|uniref:Uncharacterized protein n=1 Tax=Niveomyces insectorum RCEF 264 TaxID=1081102 RepID=A0A167UK67_9HYPO|nr:hypothetical protein SPI_04515 [Niveomyces insectorum RCEF 264]